MPYQHRPPRKPYSMRQAEALGPMLLAFALIILLGYGLAWLLGWVQ